jgi:hypothetical protein
MTAVSDEITLMMEAESTPEMSVIFYLNTQHIPEDSHS